MGDHRGEAKCLGNLGFVARKGGDLEAAAEYFEGAFHSSLDAGAMQTLYKVVMDIVDVLPKKISGAIEWCDRAIEIAEQRGDEDVANRFQILRTNLFDEK